VRTLNIRRVVQLGREEKQEAEGAA
jgi:hypothetical protein